MGKDVPKHMEVRLNAVYTETAVSGSLTDAIPVPPVNGYIRMEAGAAADVLLKTESGEPIYAEQSFGNGISAVFTSDLGNECDNWYISDAGKKTLMALCKRLLSGTQNSTAVCATAGREGFDTVIRIPALFNSSSDIYHADVLAPDETAYLIDSLKAEKGILSVPVACDKPGFYYVRVLDAEDNVLAEAESYLPYSEEYNVFPKTDGKEVLEELCVITGGRLLNGTSDFGNADMNGRTVRINLSRYLAMLVALLFFGELILRRYAKKIKV